MHLRHKPNHSASRSASHTAGSLAIDVTEIRPDDPRRDERTHPETVVHHIPLSEVMTREGAFARARLVSAGIAPAARDRYRVKVVAR